MIAVYILAPILVIFGIWLFLVAPKNDKGMEKYKSVKYAHRGLHGTLDYGEYAAENSLSAFARAAERGFGIELDVRLTKDGEAVVFHDNTLDRVTSGTGRVRDFTLEELKKLSLEGTDDTIPTFREVLQLVDGRVPILVELKSDGTEASVAIAAAEILNEYKGDFIVESFNPIVLGEIKKRMPSVLRGFLSDKLTDNEKTRTLTHRAVQRFLLNFIARPSFIAMRNTRINMQPLPIIRKLFGTPCIAWTVRSEAEEREAYESGFSGVIFENYIPDKNGIGDKN